VTDKLFIAGALLGLVSILAGVFVLTAEYEHYFPIGVILSLILIAVASYNASRKNAQRRAVRKNIEALEQEFVDLERKFVHESASIAAYLRAVGAGSPAELKEKAENYRYFSSLRQDLEEGRQRVLGESSPELLRQHYEKQQEETRELEKAARQVASDAVDTYSIRQDIERLESESVAGPGQDSGAEVFDPAHDVITSTSAGGPQGGGFLGELRAASRIGGIEMEALIPAVEAAAQRNLSAVSGGKYVRIDVRHDGPPVVRAKDDTVVGAAELSHGTKALLYLCFRTGLIEALAGKRRLPFILDDPLSGFDPARQQAACQVLRALGKKTQVVLYTANPALRVAGDAAAELK
jgi:uncharacterized protein YhaN